jgi:RNA polymerase sigma-70 factor (ECF subfamily)
MNPGEDGRDPSLLRRFRQGDEDVFRMLFERYDRLLADRVRKLLFGPVLRKVSISDVLQDARMAAFENRAAFEDRGPGALRAWLVGIAEMSARRAIKRHVGTKKRDAQRELSRHERAPTGQFVGREATPSQHAIADETAGLVRRAMAELPPDYRCVLELTREQHLPLAEAARHMERSEEATKRLRSRALFRFTEVFRRLRGECDGS